MKKINYLLLFAVLSALMTACSDDQVDAGKTLLTTEQEPAKTDLDKYLDKNYMTPYNIDFDYRFEDSEKTDREMGFQLVPVRPEKALEMAKVVKYICLDAYQKVAPKDFLKKYFPKKLRIIGSGPYDGRGNEILALATEGLEITLYHINTFGLKEVIVEENGKNISKLVDDMDQAVKLYSRVIIHEFSHIMHHKVDYPHRFRTMTDKDYLGGAWSESTEEEAYKKGFLSPYARKEYNEDFVEVLAHYVILTDAQWNDILKKAGKEGTLKINNKLELVKDYMLDVWDVDLDRLKSEVQYRLKNVRKIVK